MKIPCSLGIFWNSIPSHSGNLFYFWQILFSQKKHNGLHLAAVIWAKIKVSHTRWFYSVMLWQYNFKITLVEPYIFEKKISKLNQENPEQNSAFKKCDWNSIKTFQFLTCQSSFTDLFNELCWFLSLETVPDLTRVCLRNSVEIEISVCCINKWCGDICH